MEKYGAEFARDWFDVFLVKRVGADASIHIHEGKDLPGISYDVDETNVTTRIMTAGQDADGNMLYLSELYADSPQGPYPANAQRLTGELEGAKRLGPEDRRSLRRGRTRRTRSV